MAFNLEVPVKRDVKVHFGLTVIVNASVTWTWEGLEDFVFNVRMMSIVLI